MPSAFVHLSDIHFGQERDGRLFIHDDVKEELIRDVSNVTSTRYASGLSGVIVTGDIAYSGKKHEYTAAAQWLKRVAAVAGCEPRQIQVVPGNHDIDRDAISGAMHLMFDAVGREGATALDRFFGNERDRETFYDRFKAYREFSDAYDCPLDPTGRFAVGQRIRLAEGRHIRFIRMNSALLCSGKEKELDLLLGARQFVIPRVAGEEVVVLVHHPLNWYKDNGEAVQYVRSRVRVFISGHEHHPSVRVEHIEHGCDVMMLAAGATVPPTSDDTYSFTYNIIEFDWEEKSDALLVTLNPRAWNSTRTLFENDHERFGEKQPRVVLNCPNFRAMQPLQSMEPVNEIPARPVNGGQSVSRSVDLHMKDPGSESAKAFQLILFQFFNTLSSAERVLILTELIPRAMLRRERLTRAKACRLLEELARNGEIKRIQLLIEKTRNAKIKK